MDDVQQNYIDKYMCTASCPCPKLNSTLWGLRYEELSTRIQTGSITTFETCYNNLVKSGKITKTLSSTLLTFIQTLETDYNCLGLCKQPLFWYYNTVTLGLPTQNCRGAIASVFESSFRNVGIAFVVTGGVIFLVFNVQYGLWFRGGPKN
eukprot:403357507